MSLNEAVQEMKSRVIELEAASTAHRLYAERSRKDSDKHDQLAIECDATAAGCRKAIAMAEAAPE